MKELNNIGFICLMAMQMLHVVKTGNTPICTAKYRFMFEKQFYTACAEYDKFYAENYEDIIYKPEKE